MDDIRHGDVAIQTYRAFQCPGKGEDQFQLRRMETTGDVHLLRFLGASSQKSPALDSKVTQGMLVWDHTGATLKDVSQLKLAAKIPCGVGIIEDMVAARAFIGSGRSFEFHGSQSELKSMLGLEAAELVSRATATDGSSSDTHWYLTQKAATMLEAW